MSRHAPAGCHKGEVKLERKQMLANCVDPQPSFEESQLMNLQRAALPGAPRPGEGGRVLYATIAPACSGSSPTTTSGRRCGTVEGATTGRGDHG
eukprot:4166279-Pyramimonas_sp.AAC.1